MKISAEELTIIFMSIKVTDFQENFQIKPANNEKTRRQAFKNFEHSHANIAPIYEGFSLYFIQLFSSVKLLFKRVASFHTQK